MAMKKPRGRKLYASLFRKRAKAANWRNSKAPASKAEFKDSLPCKHRMRLRRKNSLQASKLSRSLRSSDIGDHGGKVPSPLHSFDSPETLTKKGKISRVSERSIHKVSSAPATQDEKEEGNAFLVNRRMTRGMDNEDVKKTMTTISPRSLKLKVSYGAKFQKQGKILGRTGLKNRLLSGKKMKIDSTSYRKKLRHHEDNPTESKEGKCLQEVGDSAVQKNSSKLDKSRVSKKSSQARAVLKRLLRQEKLLSGGGVTTRQKASSTAKFQPRADVEIETDLSKHPGNGNHRNGGVHGEEGKRKFWKRQSSRGAPEEVEDAQESFHNTLDQTINSVLKPEELLNDGNRSCILNRRRSMNELDDPRYIDSGKGSSSPGRPPRTAKEQGPVSTLKSQHDSAVKLRRSKRKRSPDLRAPQKDNTDSRGQIEDAASQGALAVEQGNDLVGEELLSAPTEAENEMGPSSDVLKIDPASKSCLVATNPMETGGRQMRPRPLDLEQPLLVLVEGLDEDYYELDGGSFHRMLRQQSELKSPSFNQEKTNGSSRKASHAVDAAGAKAESILIPSFRTCMEVDESLKLPAPPYVLPDSYIKAGPAVEKLQAEYDMDDVDEEWLNKYNKSVSPSSTLSVDQFEKIIDLLENKAADASCTNSITKFFEEGEEPASEECCICNGGENSASNPVYQCVSCHILVHQSCYGIRRGWRKGKKRWEWKCKKCEAVAEGNVLADISCSLCCKQGGALKPSTEPHRWAHVVCALYTNETYFINPDAMERIDGLSAADARAKRQRRQCWLCGVREGSAERCSVPGCKTVFHVSCGVTQGASFELQHSNHQVTSVRVYCPRHALRAFGAAKEGSSEGKKNTPKLLSRKFSAVENISRSEKHSESSPTKKHRQKQSSSRCKNDEQGAYDHSIEERETPNDGCSLGSFTESDRIDDGDGGEKVNARLTEGRSMDEEACAVLSEENMQELGNTCPYFTGGVYLYWVSKRAKQGGPLLHRIQQEHAAKQFGIFNPDDEDGPLTDPVSDGRFFNSPIDMKIVAAWHHLQRLQELTLLVAQRERLKLEIFSLDQDIFKTGFEASHATCISQPCSSCKGSHLALACDICNRATCMYCLTRSSRYSSWLDFLRHPKCICLDCCEKQNFHMHIELACKPCADWEEDGVAGSALIHAWNEGCGSDGMLDNCENGSQKKPLILLPRCECSHQDRFATQAFWEHSHPKMAFLLDLLKSPVRKSVS